MVPSDAEVDGDAAHPWRLLWTSTVFGGPRPNLARARVLEIGCGDGATLIPIAASEPTWTVLGIVASAALSAALLALTVWMWRR